MNDDVVAVGISDDCHMAAGTFERLGCEGNLSILQALEEIRIILRLVNVDAKLTLGLFKESQDRVMHSYEVLVPVSRARLLQYAEARVTPYDSMPDGWHLPPEKVACMTAWVHAIVRASH